MMGGVSPETSWASCKYGIIKFWYIIASCWIFFYELHTQVLCKFSLFIFIYCGQRYMLDSPFYAKILRQKQN
jgi:hypothetical protein